MSKIIEAPETLGDTVEYIHQTEGDHIQNLVAQRKIPAGSKKPALFKLRAALPKQGRGHAFLGATDSMWIMLKTYAADGENLVHTHVNEDHTFIVMQGQAKFSGPNGEISVLKKHEGILLPCGSMYSFMAEGGEPLVVLRIGCHVDKTKPAWGRLDAKGVPLRGGAAENNTVPTVFLDGQFFE
jgi:mannose-6-phosphate isomerase-like protein (cupin superfamily)